MREMTADQAGPRGRALAALLDEVLPLEPDKMDRPDEGWFDAVAALVVDAFAASDLDALELADTTLRRASGVADNLEADLAGELRAFGRVVHFAAEGLATSALPTIEPSSHAASFLRYVAMNPGASNQAIADDLMIDVTEVARTGARLRDAGLAIAHRMGRTNSWDITPRGRASVAGGGRFAIEVKDVTGPPLGLPHHFIADKVSRSLEPLRELLSSLMSDARGASPARDPEANAFEVTVRRVGGWLTDNVQQLRETLSATDEPAPEGTPNPSEVLVRAVTPPVRQGQPQKLPGALEVVATARGWAVRKHGSRRSLRVFPEKRQAQAFVKSQASAPRAQKSLPKKQTQR